MNHLISSDDVEFSRNFAACALHPSDFDHRAHLHLAYIELCRASSETAIASFKGSLLRFLSYHGLGSAKYHETMTCAWFMAVAYFMRKSAISYRSAAAFTSRNPELLDSGIMLTHYSRGVLFSQEARRRFVEPDIQPIPSDAGGASNASGV